MNPTLVYIYPGFDPKKHTELALRFIQTYNYFPPGMDHKTIVVMNGWSHDSITQALFASLPNVTFYQHDNSGWDIGAYQAVAKTFPSELMFFMGASLYFLQPNWMNRCVEAYHNHGPGIYGATVSPGDLRRGVHPHVRTTGFWMPPYLLNTFPEKVGTYGQRYPFEHGPQNITKWVQRKGGNAWLITAHGDYPMNRWSEMIPFIYTGNRPELLFADRFADLVRG